MSSTMPSWSTARHPQCFLPAILMAELERRLPYGLVADDDAAGGQHLLDHAQAERKSEIQPNRVADDLGRKAVAASRPAAKLTVPSKSSFKTAFNGNRDLERPAASGCSPLPGSFEQIVR